jgi:hypothetical protein
MILFNVVILQVVDLLYSSTVLNPTQKILLANHEKYVRHQHRKCMYLKFQKQCVLELIRRVRVRLSPLAKVHLAECQKPASVLIVLGK